MSSYSFFPLKGAVSGEAGKGSRNGPPLKNCAGVSMLSVDSLAVATAHEFSASCWFAAIELFSIRLVRRLLFLSFCKCTSTVRRKTFTCGDFLTPVVNVFRFASSNNKICCFQILTVTSLMPRAKFSFTTQNK